jgi:hypothetical protein
MQPARQPLRVIGGIDQCDLQPRTMIQTTTNAIALVAFSVVTLRITPALTFTIADSD